MSRRRHLRAVFAAPLAIALASIAGLVVALTGDGLRNAASWVALGVPALAILWAMQARRS